MTDSNLIRYVARIAKPPLNDGAMARVESIAADLDLLRALNAKLVAALSELLEVADLRGDSDLPHPCDDPKLWTARMQTAWEDARAALAESEEAAQ